MTKPAAAVGRGFRILRGVQRVPQLGVLPHIPVSALGNSSTMGIYGRVLAHASRGDVLQKRHFCALPSCFWRAPGQSTRTAGLMPAAAQTRLFGSGRAAAAKCLDAAASQPLKDLAARSIASRRTPRYPRPLLWRSFPSL